LLPYTNTLTFIIVGTFIKIRNHNLVENYDSSCHAIQNFSAKYRVLWSFLCYDYYRYLSDPEADSRRVKSLKEKMYPIQDFAWSNTNTGSLGVAPRSGPGRAYSTALNYVPFVERWGFGLRWLLARNSPEACPND